MHAEFSVHYERRLLEPFGLNGYGCCENLTHKLDALGAARANGCVLEMILKDTHTCEHHPERFTIWTQIARELVEQYATV